MKFFIDSASLDEIRHAKQCGVLDGVTTNPSKMKEAIEAMVKSRKKPDLVEYIKEILQECRGLPVSLEVIGASYAEMIKEGARLFKMFNPVAKNVYIKIPVNPEFMGAEHRVHDGLRAINFLTEKGIPVNCTLVFSPEQALLAARAGARMVSPFAGRLDDFLRKKGKVRAGKSEYFPAEGLEKGTAFIEDNGVVSGVDLVAQCVQVIDGYGLPCEVLAASIRNARQVREVALVGAHIATMGIDVLEDALRHPLTAQGMQGFTKDITPEYAKIVRG